MYLVEVSGRYSEILLVEILPKLDAEIRFFFTWWQGRMKFKAEKIATAKHKA